MSKYPVTWTLALSCLVGLVLVLITSCSNLIPIATESITSSLPSIPSISTPVVTTTIQSNQLQTYFPRSGDSPDKVLASLYGSSIQTLDIAIYSLTYPSIVKAIGDAHKRGVKVRVISDKTQAAGKSQTVAIDDLLTIGIPVKVNTHSGLMHLKISIIDSRIATTGSYNYSAGATKDNDEVLVVISELGFVLRCSSEFEKLWYGSGFKDAQLSY